MSAEEKIAENGPRVQGWPLYASLFFAAALFFAGYCFILAGTGGRWIFTLDDPYIHMAMARHWVSTGLPGINAGTYSSSSSSPLWVCLLALADLLAGVRETTPLFLNLAAAFACLVMAQKTLSGFAVQGIKSFAALLGFLFSVPLPVLVSTGMEHTLHLALLLAFLHLAALKKEASSLLLIPCAFLTAAVRPETVFIVSGAALYLFLHKRRTLALSLVFTSLLPFLLYGAWNLSQGWPFLPAPFLLKGIGVWSGDSAKRLREALPLVSLISGVLFFEIRRWILGAGKRPCALNFYTVTFLCGGVLHLAFAGIGWFYRYEAYLIGLGFLVLAGQVHAEVSWIRKPVNFLMLLLLLSPAAFRGIKACSEIPAASRNIYDQQIQMAHFLGGYYRGESVLVNDVGAVSYFSGVRVIDLFGLGTKEVLDWQFEANLRHLRRQAPPESPKSLHENLARAQKAKVAVVYEKYFRSVLPEGAVKVGTWAVSHCVACLNPEISFYALSPDEVPALKQHLLEFQPYLPAGVDVRMMPKPADK